MSNRRNFGHGQLVTEGEFDGALDLPEEAERDMALDGSQSQAVNGATPDSDVHGGILQGLLVTAAGAAVEATVALGTCKNELGQRINLPAEATVVLSNAGDTPEGDLSSALGDGADIVSSVPAGQRIVVSLFLVYDEILTDSRVDASGTPYYFQETESFHFHLAVGTAFAASPAAPPSRAVLTDGKVLLTDLLMTNDGGTLKMVASGVLNSNENWDDLGTWYLNNTGRRSDWLACDEATDYPLYDAQSTELRVRNAREGIATLIQQLQVSGSAPAGSDLLGALALTAATGGTQATSVSRNLAASSLKIQLQGLLDLFQYALLNGGGNTLTPAAAKDGIEGFATNLSEGKAFVKLHTAQAPDRPQRITGYQYGHLARAHEFFDDFFYPAAIPTSLTLGCPWVHVRSTGAGTAAPSSIRGGTTLLIPDGGGANDYITTNAVVEYDIAAAPYAIAMFRFRIPSALGSEVIRFGLYSSTPLTGAGDSAIEVEADMTGDKKLYLYTRNSGGTRGPGAVLNADTALIEDVWYTLRIVAISTTVAVGQIGAESWKTDTLGAGVMASGTFSLCMYNSSSGEALEIDQVSAADAILEADMV